MKYTKQIIWGVMLITAVIIAACSGGDSNPGQAQGATVALQAQITPGKATIFFSQYTSATNLVSTSPTADFTLKSIVNSNAGTMASDVSIDSEVISFEYIGSTPSGVGGALKIPDLIYYSNLIVPANGSAVWANVPIMLAEARTYLKANNPLSSETDELRYKVVVTFNGVEVKNGSKLSPQTTLYLKLSQ